MLHFLESHLELASIQEIGDLKFRDLLMLQINLDEERLVEIISKILSAKINGSGSKRK
jgi:hypothetical protein